jgi:DNA-binding MarR family transcriptional regulator
MQQQAGRTSDRLPAIDHLYKALAHLIRRRSELAGELHPELSLVGYTFLVEIEARRGTRATDLAARFGLDKSTVSRQVNQLEAARVVRREGERPGRRGYTLVVTSEGEAALEREAGRVRQRLGEALVQWNVGEITSFADTLDRFIDDLR